MKTWLDHTGSLSAIALTAVLAVATSASGQTCGVRVPSMDADCALLPGNLVGCTGICGEGPSCFSNASCCITGQCSSQQVAPTPKCDDGSNPIAFLSPPTNGPVTGDCGAGVACFASNFCSGGLQEQSLCMEAGGSCCPTVFIGSLHYCPSGYQCAQDGMNEYGCCPMPAGNECSRAGKVASMLDVFTQDLLCEPGYLPCGTSQCTLAGCTMCAENQRNCRDGTIPCNGGCMPTDATCCEGTGSFCGPGLACVTDPAGDRETLPFCCAPGKSPTSGSSPVVANAGSGGTSASPVNAPGSSGSSGSGQSPGNTSSTITGSGGVSQSLGSTPNSAGAGQAKPPSQGASWGCGIVTPDYETNLRFTMLAVLGGAAIERRRRSRRKTPV
jgi:hypothetical protein